MVRTTRKMFLATSMYSNVIIHSVVRVQVVVSTIYLRPSTKMMSVLLLQPRYLVLSNSFPAHCGGIIDDMASLAVETSREAAKSPLLLNRVDSTKKIFLNDIFFKI